MIHAASGAALIETGGAPPAPHGIASESLTVAAERVQLHAVLVVLRLVRCAAASLTSEIVSVHRNDAARGARSIVSVGRACVEPLGNARDRERMTT
jgi:hypothetical protein